MSKDSQREWSGKSRGGSFGYSFFVHTIRLIGVRSAYCIMALIVVYFLMFAPKATKAIWQYNRRRLGYGFFRSLKELYCHYYVFGQTLIDRIALRGGMAGRYSFEFDNYERFLQIIDSGKGVVMIGAHVGCWEAGSAFFGKYGKKINIVMYDAEHSQIKKVLEENAQESDFKIIPINQDAIAAMLQITGALSDGEYVCFNGDRYVDLNSSVPAEFLGAEAQFPKGPFLIASRCRVPVVFYYAMREPGMKYRFIFTEAECSGRMKTEDLLSQYLHSLESIVRRYPRQWFNFYPFWKSNETHKTT